MSKKSQDKKKLLYFPHQNTIVNSTNIFYPTPKITKKLVKPDFSPLINSENKFISKTNDSYKNRTVFEPESPVKTPSINYLTPINIKGKDLFGIKQDNGCFRQLDFEELEKNKAYNYKQQITDKEMNDFLKKLNMNDCDNSCNCNINPIKEKSNNKYKECNNRMEKEFIILKTINSTKFDAVYIVRQIKTNKIYCIKKSSKNSSKNNFNTILTIYNDMQNNICDNELGEKFCMKYLDYWIENENYELIKEDINYKNKNLYILLEYYPSGDILDYIGNLQKNNYNFTVDFYWDMIFEMMIGLLYFHNKGYIHFDIKPTNFLVDNDGFMKLNDFGLSHKIEELLLIDDIIEGDSRYISKELFDNNDNISQSHIDNRCDVFSLGLSILEIMAKINLPSKGNLWKKIRNENFIIPNEFLNGWNIKNNVDFLELINQMILPVDKRPTLIELINKFPQLKKRYEMIKKNKYDKSCEILKINKNENNISIKSFNTVYLSINNIKDINSID